MNSKSTWVVSFACAATLSCAANSGEDVQAAADGGANTSHDGGQEPDSGGVSADATPLADAGVGSGASLALLWYGASTTVFAGSTSNTTPQAGYSVPALVADFYEKYNGSPGPTPKVWTNGGTPLSTWRGQAAWNDATSGAYDVVISTVVRSVTPAVSPAGETNEMVAANSEINASNFMVWAPVQPQRTDQALASYLACAQENASLAGRSLLVAPVAQAMQAAREAGFVVNNGDAVGDLNPHYTRAGAYVVAATIFSHLYQVSPVGLEPEHSYLGICANPANRDRVQCVMSDGDAATLQQIALDAVMANQPTASCEAFCADVSSAQPVCSG